jgi:hypothetical protein
LRARRRRGGHIVAGHVTGSEDKLADGVLLESAFFEEVVAYPFIGCQQDPAFRAHQRQPDFISDSVLKVCEMALEPDTQLGQCVLDCAGVAEVFVEV